MASDSKVYGALQTLIEVFYKYASMDREQAKKKGAGKDQDEFTLSKSEVKKLMEKEMGKNVKNRAKLDEIMRKLDGDGDGQVDFVEFVSTVANAAYFDFMLDRILE